VQVAKHRPCSWQRLRVRVRSRDSGERLFRGQWRHEMKRRSFSSSVLYFSTHNYFTTTNWKVVWRVTEALLIVAMPLTVIV
jgi:hypothetical protein